MLTLLHGDALTKLAEVESETVQTCVTSPPYWSLRDYGIEPLVWDETVECEHDWIDASWRDSRKNDDTAGTKQRTNAGSVGDRIERPADTCLTCGAWRGCLGLEPTPELYVQHIVQIFREVKRVLRKDGTLWLNLGSSYAGSGKGGNPKVRPVTVNGANEPYALRDGLSPDEVTYVLSELARFRQGREISEPNTTVDVDAAVTSLTGSEEV